METAGGDALKVLSDIQAALQKENDALKADSDNLKLVNTDVDPQVSLPQENDTLVNTGIQEPAAPDVGLKVVDDVLELKNVNSSERKMKLPRSVTFQLMKSSRKCPLLKMLMTEQ